MRRFAFAVVHPARDSGSRHLTTQHVKDDAAIAASSLHPTGSSKGQRGASKTWSDRGSLLSSTRELPPCALSVYLPPPA
jgi:hypothetical protein